jgi:hypothetical protein
MAFASNVAKLLKNISTSRYPPKNWKTSVEENTLINFRLILFCQITVLIDVCLAKVVRRVFRDRLRQGKPW